MANNSIFSAFERMWQHIVSTFATKEELNNINFPANSVNSVNGKTGVVTLSASDVGALSSDANIDGGTW